uniref:fimbria/pilus outer membrane usher protein n=1 Tax=Castellaniella defragrans TaxID=75697 RepID=UPI003341490D
MMRPSQNRLPVLRYVCGLIAALCAGGAWAASAAQSPPEQVTEVKFNADVLQSFGGVPVDVSRFSLGNFAAPGDYLVPVSVNDRPVGRTTVRIRQLTGETFPQPCVDTDLLMLASVNLSRLDESAQALLQAQSCLRIAELIPGGRVEFDNSEQRLDLSIPQIWLNRSARGYVDPQYWDDGITAGLLRYNANLYRYDSAFGEAATQGYLGLDSGFNIGAWRFRHRGNLSYRDSQGSHYQSIQTSVQRSLPSFKSQLTLGEFFTDGTVMDSVGLRGARLASDERMYPESQRGYAPTIRGIANSNARVRIRQNGMNIYETTVAPGEFEIDDLYPTGYGGDLEVVVTEADGSEHISRVPFSAPVNALRAGTTRYSLSGGQYRSAWIDEKPYVFQGTIRHGFNNLITGYGGVTVAEHYQAGKIGVALNTAWGAFSLDATQAKAAFDDQPDRKGQSYSLSYSRFFAPTKSSVTLAAYRYSTSGFLSLTDAINRRAYGPGMIGAADTAYYANRIKSRFQLILNQPLGDRWGALYLSGYSQDYWGYDGRDTEYQFNYSNSFRRLSYGISASRQYSVYSGQWQNIYMLNLSLPLGGSPKAPYSNTTVQHNSRDRTTTINETINGSLGPEDNPLYYGLSVGHARGGDSGNTNQLNANVSWNSPYAQLGASAGRASGGGSQVGASASGAVVAWGGGVVLTPTLGDTFAIVEARGAGGARIVNASGLRLDSRGYGLVSGLTPFAQNTVEVDPQGLPLNVQFKSTTQRVAPTAGAIVPLQFEVEAGGRSAVIRARLADGEALPFGAEALDGEGNLVGTVAQGSRIIVNTLADDVGRLTVRWGAAATEQCVLDYAVPQETGGRPDLPFLLLQGTCVQGQ